MTFAIIGGLAVVAVIAAAIYAVWGPLDDEPPKGWTAPKYDPPTWPSDVWRDRR